MVHDQTPSLRPTRQYPWRTALDRSPREGCGAGAEAPAEETPPNLGVEVALEVDEPSAADQPSRRAPFEIWTKHRVYHLDTALVCLAVTSRDTGEREESPRCRGARLVGARRRVGGVLEIWRPLPVAGSVAIFSPNGSPRAGSMVTSPVERVVIRQQVRRVPPEVTAP